MSDPEILEEAMKKAHANGWKNNLMRMVIADDPIVYLGETL